MGLPFEALLFDMDGLLLDTERVFMEALVDVTRPLGLDEAGVRVFFLTLIGTSAPHTSARLAEMLPAGIDAHAFDLTWRARNKAMLSDGIPLRTGVSDVIPKLAQLGLPMAVVTSTKADPARHHLTDVGLIDYFDLIVGGDEVPANKPDPAPYLQAARALGVDPTRCAAFEDSDTGTASAVAAGCVTTQIPDLRPDIPLPDLGQHVAPDLTTALTDLGLLPTPVA